MQAQLSTPSQPKAQRPKLWELTEDILALEDLLSDIQASEDLSESDKETRIQHTLEQWLGSGQAFDDKACKVAAYIKHLEALAEARKTEYRRLRQLAERAEKQAEMMRSYLLSNMHRVGKQKIQGVLANLSLRKKPPRVILNCEPEELPTEFQKVEVTPRLSALKDYLKGHPDCPFAALSTLSEFCLTIQ
jgi:hypothetical protein